MIDKNEIKKALYKEKPLAYVTPQQGVVVRKGKMFYETKLQSGDTIKFEVSVADMGDADLCSTMSAKLLIRYLV